MNLDRLFIVIGALSALCSVGAGAFGAHGLRAQLSPELLAVFETGARYQMYHALGLIGVGLAAAHWPRAGLGWVGALFIVGTLLFSGSLYALALSGTRWLGAITPIGGTAWLIGWALLAWRIARAG